MRKCWRVICTKSCWYIVDTSDSKIRRWRNYIRIGLDSRYREGLQEDVTTKLFQLFVFPSFITIKVYRDWTSTRHSNLSRIQRWRNYTRIGFDSCYREGILRIASSSRRCNNGIIPIIFIFPSFTIKIPIYPVRIFRKFDEDEEIIFSLDSIQLSVERSGSHRRHRGEITIIDRLLIRPSNYNLVAAVDPAALRNRAQPIVTIFHRFNQPSCPRIASRWSDTLETVPCKSSPLQFSSLCAFVFSRINVKSTGFGARNWKSGKITATSDLSHLKERRGRE